MRKAAALLTLLMVGAGAAALAGQNPGTYAEAKEKGASLNKPILVDFYTEW